MRLDGSGEEASLDPWGKDVVVLETDFRKLAAAIVGCSGFEITYKEAGAPSTKWTPSYRLFRKDSWDTGRCISEVPSDS